MLCIILGKEEQILTTTSTTARGLQQPCCYVQVMVVYDKMTLVDKHFMLDMQRRDEKWLFFDHYKGSYIVYRNSSY